MDRKWKWLVKFLLDDSGQDPDDLDIHLNGKEEDIVDLCLRMMEQLHPKHKDAMLSYYRDGKKRSPMVSQGIYHGRMAMWTALRWAEDLGLDKLKELVC